MGLTRVLAYEQSLAVEVLHAHEKPMRNPNGSYVSLARRSRLRVRAMRFLTHLSAAFRCDQGHCYKEQGSLQNAHVHG
jgi:hypothetical protein